METEKQTTVRCEEDVTYLCLRPCGGCMTGGAGPQEAFINAVTAGEASVAGASPRGAREGPTEREK